MKNVQQLKLDPILVISLVIAALVWSQLTKSVYGIAVIMIVLTISLVTWFLQYKATGSEQRLIRMMTRTGLPPDIIADEKTANLIEAARRTCRKCNGEDRCEQWLDGEIAGENDFCPNAGLFSKLLIRPEQEARIHP